MASFPRCIQIFCIVYSVEMFWGFCNIYRLYWPIPCPADHKRCFKSYVAETHPPLKLSVYTSPKQFPIIGWDLSLVWENNDFKANESFTKDVIASISSPWLFDRGTVFVHVYISPTEQGWGGGWEVHQVAMLTEYTIHKELVPGDRPTWFWRSFLQLNVMTSDVSFASNGFPGELYGYIWIPTPHADQYLPALIIDEMSFRTKDLRPLHNSYGEMPLRISYTPVSYGTFDVMAWMMKIKEASVKEPKSWNNSWFTEKEKDDLKKLGTASQIPYSILAFMLIRVLLLFELLAFESEIKFWQEKKTMSGLSTYAFGWHSVCMVIMYLYAMDENLWFFEKMIFFVGAIFEIWKMFKVFQVTICWSEWRLVFDTSGVGEKERETETLDLQAMRCLSYVLYPLWLAVIIYSLQHHFKRSWYSICIQSLHIGFYSFGFVYNLPQVFINYKLKSVADLPWTALMYGAFSHFLIRICRFILTAPIDDGGLYFLDDVFYIIFLYQRWLYSGSG